MITTNRKSIGIVVTHHNYLNYLPEALESVSKQTLKPDQVIVVDDASSNPDKCKEIVDSYGYEYVETKFENPLLARKAGFKKINTEYLCFLDADDKLDQKYLAYASTVLNEADVVFTDIQHFGDETSLVSYDPNIPIKRLWQTNFMHAGCVTSKNAIEISEAFSKHPDHQNYHEDWLFWRKVMFYGFKLKKSGIPYYARVHGKNRSKRIEGLGYISKRRVNDLKEVFHQHSNKGLDFLRLINRTAITSYSDYLCFKKTQNPMDLPDYPWKELAKHLDHDVAAVHDSKYDLFDNTLIVGPVFRSYRYLEPELPFDPNTEKIIYI